MRTHTRLSRAKGAFAGVGLAAVLLAVGAPQVQAGDREDVAALVHLFARRGDQGDAAAFRSLFVTQPAIQLGSKGPLSADVFFSAWEARLGEIKANGALRRQHVTTLIVQKQAGEKASANASFLTTIVQGNDITVADTGSVKIDVVKTGGSWKIKALTLLSDTPRLDLIRLEMNESAP